MSLVLSSDVPEVRMEDYEFLSIEYLYHYIRFTAFPSISNERMKKLFMLAASIPLRDPEIFALITEAVGSQNFSLLENAFNPPKTAKSTTMKKKQSPLVYTQPAILAAVGGAMTTDDPSLRVWSLILDAYFNESDSVNSFDLFRTLIFFPIYDGDLDPIKEFITRYSTEKDTFMKNRMISGNIYNAVFI